MTTRKRKASTEVAPEAPKAKKSKGAGQKKKESKSLAEPELDSKNVIDGENMFDSKTVPESKEGKSSQQQTGIASKLVAAFSASANPLVAGPMKKYMRNQFEYVGLKQPERKSLQKPVFAANPVTSETQLVAEMKALFSQKEREYCYSALDLAQANKKLWTKKLLPVLEELVLTNSWWDTVDTIAPMIGELILKYPDLKSHMSNWIDQDNMWKRRVAILHQLKYKDKTDEILLFDFCKRRMHEEEFFIRKSIGWALRQYSRTSKQAVRKFIDDNEDGLSTLSKKEGGKYC